MKDSFPFISICIPTYNQTFFLKKVLDSILIQTYTNYEVVITDDSSTSDVELLIKDYKFRNSNIQIHYFKNSPSLGTPENWNASIRNAKGEWIKMMHHDDCFSDSEALQKFVDLIDNDEKISFVFTGSFYRNIEGKKIEHSIDHETFQQIQKNPVTLFSGNLIGPPSAVMFKNNGIYFDKCLKWLVDIDFYYNFLKETSKINYSTECLIESYLPESRVTNSCWMNKYVEVPEYLHCIHKNKIIFYPVIKHTANLFFKLDVLSLKDIRLCGYENTVPISLMFMIFAKRLIRKIRKV